MKCIVCSLLVTAVPLGAAFAQTAPQPIVAPVMQKDLADLPGREMLMLAVEYPAGTVEPRHPPILGCALTCRVHKSPRPGKIELPSGRDRIRGHIGQQWHGRALHFELLGIEPDGEQSALVDIEQMAAGQISAIVSSPLDYFDLARFQPDGFDVRTVQNAGTR